MADESKLAAPNRSIDEVVGQTDLGVFLVKYKMAIIAVVVVAAIGLIGMGAYSHFADKKFQEASFKVYQFNQSNLDALTSDKITGSQFAGAFAQLAIDTDSFKGLVPVAITASDFLLGKGDNESVKQMLLPLVDKFGKGHQGYYLRSRLAVALENLKDFAGAQKEYEWLANSGISVLAAKHYTDLGRMYLLTGNKERAKSSFKYVVDTYKASEFYRIAQNYLMEMGEE